jgi:aerotaxis receptor
MNSVCSATVNTPAGVFGVSPAIRGSALLVLAIAVAGSVALSVRRMQQAFMRIDEQFGALARGDLRQAIEPVAIHELLAISSFLCSLRAKLAYSDEVRAQAGRDARLRRVAAVEEWPFSLTKEYFRTDAVGHVRRGGRTRTHQIP